VPVVLLGDQDAPCAGTRATICSLPGHPCLGSVSPDDVVAALHRLLDDVRGHSSLLTKDEVNA
jgi:hypothetical protein